MAEEEILTNETSLEYNVLEEADSMEKKPSGAYAAPFSRKGFVAPSRKRRKPLSPTARRNLEFARNYELVVSIDPETGKPTAKAIKRMID